VLHDFETTNDEPKPDGCSEIVPAKANAKAPQLLHWNPPLDVRTSEYIVVHRGLLMLVMESRPVKSSVDPALSYASNQHQSVLVFLHSA
jgi:hypothetical protein